MPRELFGAALLHFVCFLGQMIQIQGFWHQLIDAEAPDRSSQKIQSDCEIMMSVSNSFFK